MRELEDEHAEARFVAGRRSSASWTGRRRATRSPSSTAPTPRAGCSRTRSCATASAIRSSAAPASTSAPRSRTRSAYLTLLVNPPGRGGVPARRQLTAARASARPRRRGSRAKPTRSASRSSTWPRDPPTCPAWRMAAVKAVGRFMSVMERLRERARGGRRRTDGRRPAPRDAHRDRLPRRARG